MCRAGRQWGQANALNSSTPVQNANKKSESCSRRYKQKIENVTKDTRKSNETLLNKLGRKFGTPVRLLKSYERLSCCRNKKFYAVNMKPGRSLTDQTWNSSLPIYKARDLVLYNQHNSLWTPVFCRTMFKRRLVIRDI